MNWCIARRIVAGVYPPPPPQQQQQPQKSMDMRVTTDAPQIASEDWSWFDPIELYKSLPIDPSTTIWIPGAQYGIHKQCTSRSCSFVRIPTATNKRISVCTSHLFAHICNDGCYTPLGNWRVCKTIGIKTKCGPPECTFIEEKPNGHGSGTGAGGSSAYRCRTHGDIHVCGSITTPCSEATRRDTTSLVCAYSAQGWYRPVIDVTFDDITHRAPNDDGDGGNDDSSPRKRKKKKSEVAKEEEEEVAAAAAAAAAMVVVGGVDALSFQQIEQLRADERWMIMSTEYSVFADAAIAEKARKTRREKRASLIEKARDLYTKNIHKIKDCEAGDKRLANTHISGGEDSIINEVADHATDTWLFLEDCCKHLSITLADRKYTFTHHCIVVSLMCRNDGGYRSRTRASFQYIYYIDDAKYVMPSEKGLGRIYGKQAKQVVTHSINKFVHICACIDASKLEPERIRELVTLQHQ